MNRRSFIGSLLSGFFLKLGFKKGSVVKGRVEINVTVLKESIPIGRLPSPKRYYITSQTGKIHGIDYYASLGKSHDQR